MADGRDIAVWDHHAVECNESGRKPFEFGVHEVLTAADSEPTEYPRVPKAKTHWLRDTILSLEGVTNVLDIGCGPCYWVNLFEGFRYHGFDQSMGMLNVGHKTLKDNDLLDRMVELRQGNARDLKASYPEQKFDLIFTSAVLQHNRHDPDKTEIVQGMHSILREGGYFLCTENTFRADNCPESIGNPDYTEGNSFTPEGWEKYMRANGFETVEYHAPSEYLYRRV
jgi:ubiquinone/menaquinone biosynthesis C-methylase UbiE